MAIKTGSQHTRGTTTKLIGNDNSEGKEWKCQRGKRERRWTRDNKLKESPIASALALAQPRKKDKLTKWPAYSEILKDDDALFTSYDFM